jgi:hypothetical protein
MLKNELQIASPLTCPVTWRQVIADDSIEHEGIWFSAGTRKVLAV